MSIVDKLAFTAAFAAIHKGSAVVWLRRDFLQGILVIYPSARDIEEYFANLPAEVRDELDPLLESAQPDYRRIWQQEPLNEEKRIEILCQLAADVFKTRTVKRLRARSGEFDAFRCAISLEGGEAELGFWYAHRLYNIVERGRMLGIWHGQIQSHLWDRIREAENLWYNPDLVPKGWEEFCTPSEATSDAPANRTVLEEDHKPGPPSGNRQADLTVTSSIANLRWEDLQIQFVSDERVQVTARGRTETRNYAEMGFEDRRNGKPTEAWSVLRTLAENRGSTQVGVGPARSKLVKQIQQLRKKLGELHPAVGDPLPYVHGTYRAQFVVGCRRSYPT